MNLEQRDGCVNDTGLRIDGNVPVRVIEVPRPAGAQADVIAARSTYRLAQRRASYEVLEYRCPVLKQAKSGALCPLSLLLPARQQQVE